MNLKKQKQKLIEDHIKSGSNVLSEEVLTKELLPFLENTAKLLTLETAYFWADPDQDKFATLLLQNLQNHEETKRTIYFFASEQDAKRHPHFDRNCHRVDKLPIMFALFHLLTLSDEVDEAIFYNQKGRMKELKGLNLADFIRQFQNYCQSVGITQPVAKTAPFGLA
jgi:hypothetical protein